MREPNAGDDEVMSTIDLVVRLNGSPKIVDTFVGEAGASGNADSWFYAGLAAWSVMDVTAHSLRRHGLLMDALHHLTAAVRIDAEHWPARFVRASYVTMLHSDEADEMVAFLLPAEYGIVPARQDALLLIERQTRAGVRSPFGLAAYCLAAVQTLMAGDEPAALELIRDGLGSTRPGPATGMSGHLVVPIVMALRRPELQGQPALRAALTRRCRALTRAPEPAR